MARYKVLIVDDVDGSLEPLTAMLEAAGHTVLTAPSTFGVKAVIQREQPDLVLLDADLPKPLGVQESSATIAYYSGRDEREPMAPERFALRVVQMIAQRRSD